MLCPLCETRRARRACPALGQQICAVCCGTKRLVQIECPSDCVYLATAREHPPAVVLRQQQRDTTLLVQSVRDLNELQSELFLVLNTFLLRYESPELQPLVDDDVAEAAAALAATFETASRGVIYEHRPPALSADRLANALKAVIGEVARNRGSAFDREAAVVLRRIEQAVRDAKTAAPSNRRSYLELLARVLTEPGPTSRSRTDVAAEPRLIVP